MYNQDQFIIKLGRKATLSGIVGLVLGLIAGFLLSFSKLGIIVTAIIFSGFFTSSYWGVHKLKMWYKKYEYRLNKYIWYALFPFVFLTGILLGAVGYGIIEHFLLLLAMDQQKKGAGLIGAQIILIPYLGDYYAKKINYS